MSVPGKDTIPARQGLAIPLKSQQRIKIYNKSGKQVVDTWAFTISSHMSTSQTRSALRKIRPQVGDTMVDNHCKPILTLVEDTSGGIHDMLFPACNPQRYAHLEESHRSCAENCREAAQKSRIQVNEGEVPDPLNLFMNVSLGRGDGSIELKEPECKEGSYVVLKAEIDCTVVLSACPNDISAVNGWECRDVEVEVL